MSRRTHSAQDLVLTAGARAAMERAGLSRREFLKGTGALVVCFSVGGAGMVGTAHAQGVLEGGVAGSPPADEVDSWIAVGADGMVTAYTGKCEIGQGMSIAQMQLVAEELCVPLERVNLIYSDTALTPDQGVTSGSQSHPANFNHANLAQAGATAREALLQMAAKQLDAPVEQLSVADGVIRVQSDASRSVTYGRLLQGKKFAMQLDHNAKRKPVSEWTILGKPIPRPDMPAMVTGQFEFAQNVRVPGMLHGAVVRPPAVGAKLLNVDESSVSAMPGFVKVVVKKDFVGVVAQKPWQALQIAKQLKATWTPGSGLPTQANLYDYLRNLKPSHDTLLVNSGDVDQKLSGAQAVVKATYLHPYQMHGSMGTSCAVANVQGEKATIWSPTQGVWHQKSTLAMLLGLKAENIHVMFRRGSGCYGLNGADAVTYDAALLSQAVGKPVRVQLTRKDEMAWENFGFAFVIDERASLDAQGNIVAWDHEAWAPVRGNRPVYSHPGNIVTGFLAGFEPEEFVTRSPAPEPTTYNNSSNGVPSYCAGRVAGAARGTGTIQCERSLLHNVVSPFWTGPLRSPQRLQNTFAQESFMDELAARAKADPVAYRLRHLSDPRLKNVVEAVAKAANWDSRPSPKPGANKTGVATGRGMACVAYEGNNGYASMVVELEIHTDTGKISVKKIFASNDTGPISNPDGLRNQVEGGALQGMSRALLEEVTWDQQKVTSIDWRSFHTLPLGFDIPTIECVLIKRMEGPVAGSGETSITVVAAAIANAIFDATGVRIRQIPFTPERVKAALA